MTGEASTVALAPGESVRFLAIFTPSGLERFFERMAAAGSRPGGQAMFAATGRDVGLDVVGPPLAVEEAPG